MVAPIKLLKELIMKFVINVKKRIDAPEYQFVALDLINCQCTAQSIDQGMAEIKNVIIEHLSLLAEYGEALPIVESIESHLEKLNQTAGIWFVLDIDESPFLGKSHKINVTLPELLIKRIDDRVAKSEEYKTRSGFLAIAASNLLQKNK